MAQTVYTLGARTSGQPFTFTVPGQYRWTLLSVHATLARGNLAANTRTLTLTLTDSTNAFFVAPYLDGLAGTTTLDFTWAPVALVATTVAASPYVNVPLPAFTLDPGYQISGAIVNGHASDQWTGVQLWVEELAT